MRIPAAAAKPGEPRPSDTLVSWMRCRRALAKRCIADPGPPSTRYRTVHASRACPTAGRTHRRRAAKRHDGADWNWPRNFWEVRGRARARAAARVRSRPARLMMPKIEGVSVLKEIKLGNTTHQGSRARRQMLTK